ncbi:histidine phosphatase family protein [Hydrogenophaga crassostreae]|uniref:Histidine phosphatase family protein n=1 Tax=Hydrogenophaga crassostreae TaxID=1763535 RepID=A0A167HYF0_9BURK|nr:histidine phosphatase family protein [Hydrogenophaga crassostreae]AOW13601.1 histidine phosphatase family protein [Hydrogenophaga crassostreae]OAD41897.1 histidine phosphatase family protein [Hydrogenophaga crassostreae]
MDLILWRHAQAQFHPDPVRGVAGDGADLARRLTPRGEKQASRMGAWLDRQLPSGALVLSSPAIRAEQTALALGRKVKINDLLAPDAAPLDLLEAAQWPTGKQTVVLVGHQPNLGRVVAGLLGLSEPECAIKKGALWWLRFRERDGLKQTIVVSVQTPELL